MGEQSAQVPRAAYIDQMMVMAMTIYAAILSRFGVKSRRIMRVHAMEFYLKDLMKKMRTSIKHMLHLIDAISME